MNKPRICYLVTANGNFDGLFSNLSKVWRDYLASFDIVFTPEKTIETYHQLYRLYQVNQELDLLGKKNGKNFILNIYKEVIK